MHFKVLISGFVKYARPRTRSAFFRAFVCGWMLSTLSTIGSAAQRQILTGHVPDGVFKLHAVSTLNSSRRLDLIIGLPSPNQAQLAKLLDQLYDPADPNFHRYLTVDQFTARFGPTSNDYQKLIAFAQDNGFKITGKQSNRMVLKVNATVAQIEHVFHIHLRQYQHPTEGRLFYAPDAEPSIDFATPVLHVSGLDNYTLPRPGGHAVMSGKSHKAPPIVAAKANGGSGPYGSYQGYDFRAAYAPGVTLTGVGQSVGLVEFDGYYANDITTYESQTGLPNVPLTNVLVGGASGVPSNDATDILEVSLDIEMALSMAPGLSKIMVYEGNALYPDELLSQMATDNLAQQISCSWSIGGNPTVTQILQEFAAQGQSFFVCSFDGDAYYPSQRGSVVPSPVDYPYTIAVGGTTLTTDSNGSWSSECVWNFDDGTGSGGGPSSNFPIPSWQTNINMSAIGGSTNYRNIPDVACVASGIYVVYDNGVTTAGGWGTSFAAPLWAGFAALANQQAVSCGLPRIGYLNPLLYQISQSSLYHNAFHDITNGNNTNSANPGRYFAAQGYDLCTGLGTPIGSNLINLLAPLPTSIALCPPAIQGGHFQFAVAGLAFGTTNYLQSCANLSSPSNWVSIATNVATNTSMVISGLNPTNPNAQFFRIIERP